MSELEFSFIIWGIITLVFLIFAFLFYYYFTKYNGGVGGFENRKEEIALAVVLCTFVVSALMFLPVLFSTVDLKTLCSNLWDQISFAESDAIDNEQNLSLPPFVKSFAYIVTAMAEKVFRFLYWFIPSLVSVTIVYIVLKKILFTIREPEDKYKEKDNRKHLFEYDEEQLEQINKGNQR